MHAFNPSTWEAKADGSLSLFQDSQGYTEKSCLKKTKTNKTKTQKQNKTKQTTLVWTAGEHLPSFLLVRSRVVDHG